MTERLSGRAERRYDARPGSTDDWRVAEAASEPASCTLSTMSRPKGRAEDWTGERVGPAGGGVIEAKALRLTEAVARRVTMLFIFGALPMQPGCQRAECFLLPCN